MSKKTEVIAHGKQSIFMNFYFPLVIEVGQDPSVLPEQTMDVADKIIRIPVEPVVVIVPALI
jgi:hypothetical protein